MKKRNITIDITRKKDEYMYNYLMSTLKKSMLAYDPNWGRIRPKGAILHQSNLRDMNIYTLRLMQNY
jgi:hypothetical protein